MAGSERANTLHAHKARAASSSSRAHGCAGAQFKRETAPQQHAFVSARLHVDASERR